MGTDIVRTTPPQSLGGCPLSQERPRMDEGSLSPFLLDGGGGTTELRVGGGYRHLGRSDEADFGRRGPFPTRPWLAGICPARTVRVARSSPPATPRPSASRARTTQ